MNQQAWSEMQAAELSRLSRVVATLRKRVWSLERSNARKDRRIENLYQRLREAQTVRRDRDRWYGR